MINGVTMKINVDEYILNTLKEDITSEDVSTNAVMPEDKNRARLSLSARRTELSAVLEFLSVPLSFLMKPPILKQRLKTATLLKAVNL